MVSLILHIMLVSRPHGIGFVCIDGPAGRCDGYKWLVVQIYVEVIAEVIVQLLLIVVVAHEENFFGW